jgi:hypothetical protein
MVLQTSHFYTTLVGPGHIFASAIDFHWVSLTWHPPLGDEVTRLEPENLKKFLRQYCGKNAVGSIVPNSYAF